MTPNLSSLYLCVRIRLSYKVVEYAYQSWILMRKANRIRAIGENFCGLLRGPAFETGAYSHFKRPLFDLVKLGFGKSTGIYNTL